MRFEDLADTCPARGSAGTRLSEEAYKEFKALRDRSGAGNPGEPMFLCFEQADRATVPKETIDAYIKSFENLFKNGATNRQTLDAFKDICKAMPDLDQKALSKALDAAAKKDGVSMRLIGQHLKEILAASGFKEIGGKLEEKEGGILMKNPDTETYIDIAYRSKSARAIVEHKRARSDH